MYSVEECLYSYRSLISLLEEDIAGIGNCLQGEMLEEYRRIVQKEKELLESVGLY